MTQTDFYYSSIEGILCIKTNLEGFKYSYGVAMPAVSRSEYEASLIKIDVEIVDGHMEREQRHADLGKFHYFSGRPNEGTLYYDRDFLFNQKLQLDISGMHTNHVSIRANRNYLRVVTHRFMNLHSVGYIATDIANLRLLHNNLAPLHCAGISRNGLSHIIFAPPNTGKTLTAMTIGIDDDRYSYVAEDLAVTDGTHAFAVPWTSTFRYYDSIDSGRWSRALNRLTEKVAVLELLPLGKVEKVTEYIASIEDKSEIAGLFILDRGPKRTYDVTDYEAFRRINTLDRYEFNYMRAPAIIAYEYFNPQTDIEGAYAEERKILRLMIQKAPFTKVVSAPEAPMYAEIIKELIE